MVTDRAVRPIPVGRPYLWGNELQHLADALDAGWVSSRGPVVSAFEDAFAARLGRRHAISVSSGTAAVHLALESLGIGPGDEVIVPDFCMAAPIFAVVYCGAVPVPVDVDDTWNMDPAAAEAAITTRTRAILVVHNYGHPAAMHRIAAVAARRGLPVVEDAAEALGATVAGRPAGSFGTLACFSFFANKLITTGEGGMVVTDRPERDRRARWKRDMCFGLDGASRYTHAELGFNYRMSSVQAAVGLAQLEHFDDALAGKRAIARQYGSRLAGTPGLLLPPEAPWATHAYWVYGVVLGPDFGTSRDELQHRLASRGVETRRFFSAVHEQPFLRGRAGAPDCPRSRWLSGHGLYLPSFLGMTEADVDRVAEEVRTAGTRRACA